MITILFEGRTSVGACHETETDCMAIHIINYVACTNQASQMCDYVSFVQLSV